MRRKFYDGLVFVVVAAALLIAARYSERFVPTGYQAGQFMPSVIEPRDSMYGVAAAGEDTIWLAGNNGKLVRSENGGKTWFNLDSGRTEHLQSIDAWNSQRAVAVGNQGIVIVTADGGKTWKVPVVPRSEIANKLIDVHIDSNGRAWAVGLMGMIMSSEDGGATWQRRIAEEDVALNGIDFVDSEVGVVVGEFGTIKRTENGGRSWEAVGSPVQTSLMSVAARDRYHWAAVGLEGMVLNSTDAGRTWSQVAEEATKEHLLSLKWLNDNWVAVGNKGMFVTGNPAASRWKARRLSATELLWHTDIAFLGSKYIIAGGTQGFLENGRWTYIQ